MRILADELKDIVQADRVHYHQIESKAQIQLKRKKSAFLIL